MPPENQPPTIVASAVTVSLRSPGALLKDAWKIYTERLGTLLGVHALPLLFATGITAVGAFSLMGTFQTFIQLREFTPAVMSALAGVLVGVLFVLLGFVWGSAALLSVVTDTEGRIGVVEAYRKGWHLLAAYVWVGILTALSVGIGFVLLIIPGIIVGVWVSLSGYVLIVEGARGVDALRRSKAYVQGHWWAVFGRLCVIYLLYFVVAAIVGVFESIVGAPKDIMSPVINLVVTPFLTVYFFLVYQDLKKLSSAV